MVVIMDLHVCVSAASGCSFWSVTAGCGLCPRGSYQAWAECSLLWVSLSASLSQIGYGFVMTPPVWLQPSWTTYMHRGTETRVLHCLICFTGFIFNEWIFLLWSYSVRMPSVKSSPCSITILFCYHNKTKRFSILTCIKYSADKNVYMP